MGSTNKAKITFTPALAIPAGVAQTYWIRAGITDGTTAGKTAALGIAAAADVSAGSATVSGTFPVTGNAVNVVALSIAALTVDNDGAVVDSQPDVGTTDVTINQFKLVNDSTEPVTIEQVSLTESGTAALSDSANIELYDVSKAQTVATTASWSAQGVASFSNLSIKMAKGETRRFKVMADVTGGSSLTLNADLSDGGDILVTAKGDTYGFYITVALASGSTWNGLGVSSGTTTVNQTIQAGSLTVSKASTTPATGNIAPAADQVLARFDFLARGEEVKVTALTVFFVMGAGFADTSKLTNVRLYDEAGAIVAGPLDLTADTTGAQNTSGEDGRVPFTDVIIVPTGTHTYTLKGDVNTSEGGSTDTIQAVIDDPDSDLTVKGLTSNDSITAGPTSTAVSGNVQTVLAGALAITTLSSPAARSIPAGIQDFVFATASLNANGSGEDVLVSTLTVQDDTTTAGSPSDLDNLEIWADLTSASSSRGDAYETRIANPFQLDSTTVAGADSNAFTLLQTIRVPKDGTVLVAAVADLSTSADASDKHTVNFITDSNVSGADTGASVTETYTGDGQVMTVAAAGTLTTAVDAGEPSASILVAGTTGVTVGAFKLTSNNVEDLDLDQLTFNVTGSTRVATLYAYNGTTLLKSFPVGGTSPQSIAVDFADNTLVIPANTSKVVTVKADLYTNTTAVADNEIDIAVGILDADATGKSSGTQVSDTDDIGGNTHQYYRVYPKFTVNASSPSGTLIPSSNSLLAIFDVTATGNDDVTFSTGDADQIVLNVSQSITDSDGALETFELRNYETGTSLDTTAAGATGTEIQSTTVTFDFTDASFTVPAGTTKRLAVYSNTQELEDTGDSIQVWLDDSAATNLIFSIDEVNTSTYDDAVIIFRGDIYAGALVRP
ncbi:MAG: hypothetical protein HYV55_01745 [Parcubacteria group bacterium]|nr:hypothetical protein [Parcubacteria group bacterium]